MAASQGRPDIANALAGACHRLFTRCPELVGYSFRQGPAADLGCLAVLGDFDTAELGHGDGDTGVHLTQRRDAAVHAIVCEEREPEFIGNRHLSLLEDESLLTGKKQR